VWHDVPQQDTHIHTNGVSLHPTPHKSVLEKDVRETKPNLSSVHITSLDAYSYTHQNVRNYSTFIEKDILISTDNWCSIACSNVGKNQANGGQARRDG